MAEEDEAKLLRESCAFGVVRCGGECDKDRVLLQGEDDPSDLQEGGLVADCVAKDSAILCGEAALFHLAERKAFHEVLKDCGVEVALLVSRGVCQMLHRARDHGEESSGHHCGVALERRVSYPGDIVEDVGCDDE